MKTREWKIEDGGWQARSVLECRGQRSATPLSEATGTVEKLRRRRPLPEQPKTWRLIYFCFLLSVFSFRASGQSYSIDWYKIAGGGGTSTNGQYAVTGTIGQPDASGAMTGGNYSLTGGFWSLISVVQTAGAPNLMIVPNGPNSVKILWPNTGSYTLEQNANLALANGWATTGYSITNGFGTNFCTITPPVGNLFFRLKQ